MIGIPPKNGKLAKKSGSISDKVVEVCDEVHFGSISNHNSILGEKLGSNSEKVVEVCYGRTFGKHYHR